MFNWQHLLVGIKDNFTVSIYVSWLNNTERIIKSDLIVTFKNWNGEQSFLTV